MPSADTRGRRLFRRFNSMATAVAENEALAARLADEDASRASADLLGMAHEINNPLGGLFNAIDTLKSTATSRWCGAKSLSLIERGLSGIREVVRAALATYRGDETGATLTRDDFEDVRVLLGPELEASAPDAGLAYRRWMSCPLPGMPVRQTVLNLLLNACCGERRRAVGLRSRPIERRTVPSS